MSWKAVQAVRDNSKQKDVARLILMVIATYCNEELVTDSDKPLSISGLSEGTKIENEVIEKTIGGLIASGEISGYYVDNGWVFSIELSFQDCDFLYENPSRYVTKSDRSYVVSRDGGKCRYCGEDYDHIDHVLPHTKGGESTPDNLVCACASCNLRKSSKTPEEAGMRLMEMPQ